MVKVTVKEDCGNSPETLLLRDFNIAVANVNLSFIEQSITSDVIWNLFEPSSQKQLKGKTEVLEEYKVNLVIVPKEFVIESIITHGKLGAVNGIIRSENGNEYVFCDIYRFSSTSKGAKIKEMTSYIIEIKEIHSSPL